MTAQRTPTRQGGDGTAPFMGGRVGDFADAPEYAANFSLDRHIARARKSMGEARWKQLNDEWSTPLDGDKL